MTTKFNENVLQGRQPRPVVDMKVMQQDVSTEEILISDYHPKR